MYDVKKIALSSEEQIIERWKNQEQVKVSILCATFNHEKYLEDAIKGFLIQQTNFAFEIIIHDDASADNTQNIIKKYQALYPNIIKPILQIKNQFSKGGFKPSAEMGKKALGEFVALCEGDDYWIDENKLQAQYEQMVLHPEINLCVHDAETVNAEGERSDYQFEPKGDDIHIVPFQSIFKGTKQFAPTASMLMRTSIIKKLPSFFYKAPVGDFYLEVLSGQNGVLYLPQKMSVYRRESVNSWSSTVLKDLTKRIEFSHYMLKSLSELALYLPEEHSKHVRHKELAVYEKLAFLYLQKHQRIQSLKYYYKFLKCGKFNFSQLSKYLTNFILR